ncbi:MAG: hypothetical protein ACN4GT_12215, partial [Gammaproteobacteria bacterium]
DPMRDTAQSVRPLTKEERESIVAQRIRIAAAEEGETITELSARTENSMPPTLTAAINGRELADILETGTLIKILREEAYFGN